MATWAAGTLLAILLVGCGSAVPQGSIPAPIPSESQTTSAAAALTRAQVVAALGGAGLQVTEPKVAFRPAESPALAAAPRSVLQVVLPNDPDHGYLLIYEFRDASTAAAAGAEMAAYIVSGPGRIQFPGDARHVLRQVGTTLVFFTWSPGSSPDPGTAKIAQALESVGVGIAVGA